MSNSSLKVFRVSGIMLYPTLTSLWATVPQESMTRSQKQQVPFPVSKTSHVSLKSDISLLTFFHYCVDTEDGWKDFRVTYFREKIINSLGESEQLICFVHLYLIWPLPSSRPDSFLSRSAGGGSTFYKYKACYKH